jgi:hypothetical protein
MMATKTDTAVECSFTKVRETKNTFVFSEDDQENPRVGNLYVQKTAAEELGNPEKITVTITIVAS